MTLLVFKGIVSELPPEYQDKHKELSDLLKSEAKERLTSKDENSKVVAVAAYMELMGFIMKELENR